MLRWYCYLFAFQLFLFYGTPVSGQSITDCLSTANNAVVLVPSDVTDDLGDGASLTPGDEIAVFTKDDVCAGVGRWDGDHLAITVAGTDSESSEDFEPEGYQPEEPLKFSVWDASSDTLYAVDATYQDCDPNDALCRDDGLYETDAFYLLSRLTVRDSSDESEGDANLRLSAVRDSARAEVGQPTALRFVLTNDGSDGTSDIEVTTTVPAGLTIDSTAVSRGRFHASDGTWTVETLEADASDTLTVAVTAEQHGTFTFATAVSDHDAAGEDTESDVTVVAREPVECALSALDYEKTDQTSNKPGTITLTLTNTDGLLGVNFVDADGQPALDNLTATPSNDAFTSSDGIHWEHTSTTDAPTEVAFTLTQEDRNTRSARYEAEALSVCPDPDPKVTRFDPSPPFTFARPTLEATLQGNTPNPFRQQTTIHFEISAAAEVQLTIYDVLGREVATLVDELLPSGPHAILWDGRSDDGHAAASGVYLYRLQVEDNVQTGQMSILR